MMEALTRYVEEGAEIPGDVFLNGLLYERCDDIFEKMECPDLEEAELDIISKVLMNVYQQMLVEDKFCLETSFVGMRKEASEVLIDSCLGFLCLDFIMLRDTKYFCKDSHLQYRKNTPWTPPHFFRRRNDKKSYYKWTRKCDAELSFRVHDEEDFVVCLLVFAEHSRKHDNKDIKKIQNLSKASGETLQLIVGDKLN